jgi:CHAT domain-containing protein
MSVEQAKNVTADFGAREFPAPPRTIADITAILDQQKPDESYRAVVKARLDEPPPVDASAERLAEFYTRRTYFALQAGRGMQAVADGREGVRYGKDANYRVMMQSLGALRAALRFVGEPTADVTREIYARSHGDMWSMSPYIDFTQDAIRDGNVDAARRFVELSDQTLTRMLPNEQNPNGIRGDNALTHASYDEAIGRMDEAERWAQKAVDYARANALAGPTVQPQSFSHFRFSLADWILGNHTILLTRILIKQGRLTDAEVIARESLLYNLQRSGRTSPQTANSIGNLSVVLLFQGRNHEAELLKAAQADTREALGIQTWSTRYGLADIVAIERRSIDAIHLYEDAEGDERPDPSRSYLSRARILALYDTGDATTGRMLAQRIADRSVRLSGYTSFDSAIGLGMGACGYSYEGKRAESLEIFRSISPQLYVGGSRSSVLDQQFRAYVLEAHLGALLGHRAGVDPGTGSEIAEAFQIADALQVATTDRAVAASVARSNLRDAQMGELARREQDTQQQVAARLDILANALAQPVEQQNAAALATLRSEIDKLRQARSVLMQEIEKRFPDYASLINPPAATIEKARNVLTNDEALVALYAGEKEGYVWALRKTGLVAFRVIQLRREQLANMVGELRRALDPNARTLGEIPPFDVALAYKLYAAILEPVEAGWKGAKTLIVAPHGPLAQIPFSLLVTRPVPQPQDRAALFSGYQDVPFLLREVAVTQVPSVAALAILRGMPPVNPARRAFVGFGDPWFSAQQATQARAEQAQNASVATRSFYVRAAPATETMASATIASLPRLADTAEEVREVAAALRADPTKDVFLGPAANEWQVRNVKLDDRRVVMFATHGLVPGDLDGLVQPALALTAPSVANVDGDGLLTMAKILGLKLDADWVVLSACNTAAGDGAGAEAVSGLGRAFFYAGARALLVTNWSVETTSARKLTTTVFERQAASPSMSRAEALRQSMLSLIDGSGSVDKVSGRVLHSYAHPIFWAPFSLVGDGR